MSNYKKIEQLAIKHWPAHIYKNYDGWLLNISDGYTKRANCINIVEKGDIPLELKILYCEQQYSNHQLPTIYKITSFCEDIELDYILAQLGYNKENESLVLYMSLDKLTDFTSSRVKIYSEPTEEWLQFKFKEDHIPLKFQSSYTKIVEAIDCKVCYLTLFEHDQIVATAFATLENNIVGIYSLITAKKHHNKGYGTEILMHLLKSAKLNGATHSYILVVADNAPALNLYKKLGYEVKYTYWYRVKNMHNLK